MNWKSKSEVLAYRRARYKKNKKRICEQVMKSYWKHRDSNLLRMKKYRSRKRENPAFVENERLRMREHYRKNLAYYALRNLGYSRTEEQRARVLLGDRIRRGKIIKPTLCDSCNRKEKLDGHHYDGYKNPFKVMWLCRSCHSLLHKKK